MYHVVKRFIPFVVICLYFFYLTFYVKHNIINISGCYILYRKRKIAATKNFFLLEFGSILRALLQPLFRLIHSGNEKKKSQA